MPLDLPFAYRQSESRTPIVLLYTQEANMVEKLVIEGAQKKQVCKLSSNETGLIQAYFISQQQSTFSNRWQIHIAEQRSVLIASLPTLRVSYILR